MNYPEDLVNFSVNLDIYNFSDCISSGFLDQLNWIGFELVGSNHTVASGYSNFVGVFQTIRSVNDIPRNIWTEQALVFFSDVTVKVLFAIKEDAFLARLSL